MTQPLVGITGRRRDASVLAAPSGFADAPLDIFFADYATAIHPYHDGHSSQRVMVATERLLRGELGPLAR